MEDAADVVGVVDRLQHDGDVTLQQPRLDEEAGFLEERLGQTRVRLPCAGHGQGSGGAQVTGWDGSGRLFTFQLRLSVTSRFSEHLNSRNRYLSLFIRA